MAAAGLEAIWVKRAKSGVMDQVESATLEAGSGIEGNADRGGKRQVTIIAAEAWREMMAELGADLDPSARRANLMVHGLRLADTRGRMLRIGACQLRVNGETRPCGLMEKTFPGLQQAMDPDWRGGIYCEVLVGGSIQVGDTAAWEEDDDAAAS